MRALPFSCQKHAFNICFYHYNVSKIYCIAYFYSHAVNLSILCRWWQWWPNYVPCTNPTNGRPNFLCCPSGGLSLVRNLDFRPHKKFTLFVTFIIVLLFHCYYNYGHHIRETLLFTLFNFFTEITIWKSCNLTCVKNPTDCGCKKMCRAKIMNRMRKNAEWEEIAALKTYAALTYVSVASAN